MCPVSRPFTSHRHVCLLGPWLQGRGLMDFPLPRPAWRVPLLCLSDLWRQRRVPSLPCGSFLGMASRTSDDPLPSWRKASFLHWNGCILDSDLSSWPAMLWTPRMPRPPLWVSHSVSSDEEFGFSSKRLGQSIDSLRVPLTQRPLPGPAAGQPAGDDVRGPAGGSQEVRLLYYRWRF